jgi:hypothetical protein
VPGKTDILKRREVGKRVSKPETSWAWWYISVIPVLGRLRQEDHEFGASWGYIARPCLKKKAQSQELAQEKLRSCDQESWWGPGESCVFVVTCS